MFHAAVPGSAGMFCFCGIKRNADSQSGNSTTKRRFRDRLDIDTHSLIDWISDTRSQGYTNLQSFVKSLDDKGIAS